MVDVDLVNSLQSLLEERGLLNDIRAKLRSTVLQLLKNNDDPTDVDKKSGSKKAVSAFVVKHGTAAIELCFDLLSTLELNETLSVLQAETGFETFGNDRDALARQFGALRSRDDSVDKDRPVLVDVINKARSEKSNSPPKANSISPPTASATATRSAVFRSASPVNNDSPPGTSNSLSDRRPSLAPITTNFSLADSSPHNAKSSPSWGVRTHSPVSDTLGESTGSLERYSPKASPLSQSAASVPFHTSKDKDHPLELSTGSLFSTNSKEKDATAHSSSQETINGSVGSSSARVMSPLGAIKSSSPTSTSTSSLPMTSSASLQGLPPLLSKSRAVLPSISGSSVSLSPESTDGKVAISVINNNTMTSAETISNTKLSPQNRDDSFDAAVDPVPTLHSPSSVRSSSRNNNNNNNNNNSNKLNTSNSSNPSNKSNGNSLEESIEELDESISMAESSAEYSPLKPDTDDVVDVFSAPKLNISTPVGPSSRVLRVIGGQTDNASSNRGKVTVGRSGSAITRSTAGWGVDFREEDDDFVFTDDYVDTGKTSSPPASNTRPAGRNIVPTSIVTLPISDTVGVAMAGMRMSDVDADGVEDSANIVIEDVRSRRTGGSESITRKSFISLDVDKPSVRSKNNQEEEEEESGDEYGDDFEDTDDSASSAAEAKKTVAAGISGGWASIGTSSKVSKNTKKTNSSLDNSVNMLEDLENDDNEVSISVASNVSDVLEFSIGESNNDKSNDSFSFQNDPGKRGSRGAVKDSSKSVQSSNEFSVMDELTYGEVGDYDHSEIAEKPTRRR